MDILINNNDNDDIFIMVKQITKIFYYNRRKKVIIKQNEFNLNDLKKLLLNKFKTQNLTQPFHIKMDDDQYLNDDNFMQLLITSTNNDILLVKFS